MSPYLTECVCCIYMLENFVSQHIRVLGDCVSPDMRVFEILCVTISHSISGETLSPNTRICCETKFFNIYIQHTHTVFEILCVAISHSMCVYRTLLCLTVYVLSIFVGDTLSVAVCCSVLQCVAVCCSVLQCLAVCCSIYMLITFVGDTLSHGGHVSQYVCVLEITMSHSIYVDYIC